MVQSVEEKLREENRQLEKALQEKNVFIAKIAHDLRFPLNGIIGFAELMQDGKIGPVSSAHKDCLGDILESAHQVLMLVNEIIDFAKADVHKMQFYPDEVYPEKMLKETEGIFQKWISTRHIIFETCVDPKLTKIYLDPVRLKQIVYNYVSNALKHAPENHGAVRVCILPEKKHFLRLEVHDNGEGIPKEDVDKLFVEFQQLDSSAKKYPGAGLGLAFTKRIVTAQGGEVGVKSDCGKGTQFFAILPYTTEKVI